MNATSPALPPEPDDLSGKGLSSGSETILGKAWSLGSTEDLQAFADKVAEALPPASAEFPSTSTQVPTFEVGEPTYVGLESLKRRWRDLGFDETLVAADARATIHIPGEALPPQAFMDLDLPRISIHLPGSQAPHEDAGQASPVGRPDLEVQHMLGEGGMGRVFLARQRSLDREVAVKTLRDRAPAFYRDSLLAEGAVTGYLEHPSIIPVHALGFHDDGRPVLVMKRVDGVAWRELLLDPAHPAWEGWGGDEQDRLVGHLEILMQVCNAAHFAHSRGIVHRDIKPPNVMIGRFGEVYLADWGLAYRMDAKAAPRVCGTPGYMAPELALGQAVDARTDVYLLGATLHEILTGRVRHSQPDVTAMMMNAVTSAPFDYPPSVPAGLATLATWANQRDPKDRPASAAEFRRAIADHLRHKSSSALSGSVLPRLARLRELAQGQEARDAEAHRFQDQLITETRFALTQALEEWPENTVALRAFQELEELLALGRDRMAELERMARDLDPAVSSRQRGLAIAGLAGAAIGVSLPLVIRGPRFMPSPTELFLTSLVPLVVLAAFMILLRVSLAKSAVNRRTAMGLCTIVVAISLSRLLGLQAGVSGSMMLLYDSLIAAALAGFGATLNFRWLGWVAALLFVSAAACAFFPAFAYLAFSLATSSSLLIGLIRPGKAAG